MSGDADDQEAAEYTLEVILVRVQQLLAKVVRRPKIFSRVASYKTFLAPRPRFLRLSGCNLQDIRTPEILTALNMCLSTGADDEEELSEKVVKAALGTVHIYCIWDVQNKLIAAVDDDDDESAAADTDEVLARRCVGLGMELAQHTS